MAILLCVGFADAVHSKPSSAAVSGAAAEGRFVPRDPTLLLNTATGNGAPQAGKIPAHGSITFQVTGRAGIPAAGVSAVAMTIQAVGPTAFGWFTVHPSDASTTVQTLTFAAGETATGADLTRLTSTGQVTVVNNSDGETDVAIWTRGYFLDATATQTGDLYYPLGTAYLYDTRSGQGIPSRTTPLAAGESVDFDVAGRQGIPDSGATAVAVNLVATQHTARGRVTLVPSDRAPAFGGLPYQVGESTSVLFIAPLSATGKLKLTNHGTGTVHISITTRGYLMGAAAEGEAGTQFTPTPATVILQTLDGTGAPGGSTAPVAAGSSITFNATGFAGQDADRVLAAALNINVRRQTGQGYLTVYSAEEEDPGISSVVFTSDGDRSNGFDLVIPSSEGRVTITNHSGGTVHIEVSARGYFTVPASQIEHSDLPDIPIADESLIPVAGGSRNFNLRPNKYPWEKVQGEAEGTLWWYGSAPYANYLKSRIYDNVPDGACIALVVRIDGKLYSNKDVRDCGADGYVKKFNGWIRDGYNVKFAACKYKKGEYWRCNKEWD
jgi:hypothetical protein